MADKDKMIKALVDTAEGDSPLAILKGKIDNMKHSTKYLYGSDKAYDAFENRNWNQLAAGLSTVATDFSDKVVVEKLSNDLDYYYRENPKALKSLHRAKKGLPDFWPVRTKIDDLVADGSIATAEITQARKLNWLPKNKQMIQAEEGKIFPVSIDIQWSGHQLSKIEASWLNLFNKEGSQAYKMSFAHFLVNDIMKKARKEDDIAQIKGIYTATPDNATVAGNYINRQNGLLYHFWKAREVDKKYRAFNLGAPTTSNIVDYIDNFMKSLPQDVRNSYDLQFELSPSWLQAYKRRYEVIHGTYNDYDGYPKHPKDYPGTQFVPLDDLEGSDFMFVTFNDNIEILENLPKEKSQLKFELFLRNIHVFGDYKLGIRLIHIGRKIVDGDPDEFNVQSVWSNNMPIFTDEYAPVYDDATGIITATYNNLEVQSGWSTDITTFEGMKAGQVVKIKGSTNATGLVKNNAVFSIGSDYDLSTGGTLTLYVNPDLTLKKLTSTSAPDAAASTDVNLATGIPDATLGDVFRSTHAATTAITEIANGVEGQEITIYGQDNNLINVTLSTTGNITVASNATLAVATDFVKLVKVGDAWIETSRVVSK